MRESKLYLIESQQIAKAYDIKINQIKRAIAELQNICPKNYFKPNQRKDKIVPSNWENLDFNIYNRYNDDINLSINNSIWVKAFHGTGRNCKNENEIRDMIDDLKMGLIMYMLIVMIYIILEKKLELVFMLLLI